MGGIDLSLHNLPLVGGFFDDPAEKYQQQQFNAAAQRYSALTPELMQAKMNAMRQGTTMFQPYQDAMAQMYGPGGQMDLSQALQDPASSSLSGIPVDTPIGDAVGQAAFAERGGAGPLGSISAPSQYFEPKDKKRK